MRRKKGYRGIIGKVVYYGSVTLVLIVVLIGSWCVPPGLLEKVMQGIKAKFNTEVVRRD